LIIILGGDGMFNEAINGILTSNQPQTLILLLPNGTSNDFCRSQNFIFEHDKVIYSIQNQMFKRYDVGKVSGKMGDRYFLNVMDIGFGGLATELLDKQRKKGLTGGISYFIAILRTFFKYKKPTLSITIDGQNIHPTQTLMVAICNGPCFGNGLYIHPGACPDDGYFGITILGNVTLWDYVSNISILKQNKHIKHNSIQYLSAKNINLQVQNGYAPIETDGEVFGDGNCSITLLPDVLHILQY